MKFYGGVLIGARVVVTIRWCCCHLFATLGVKVGIMCYYADNVQYSVRVREEGAD